MAGRSKRRHRARSLLGPLRYIAGLEHRVSDRGTTGDSQAQGGIFRLRRGFVLAAFPVVRSGLQLATLAMKSAVVETESEMAGRFISTLSCDCASEIRRKISDCASSNLAASVCAVSTSA